MPKLVLIRHGQSSWNLENRFTGWWDVDLTEQGEREAWAAGELMRDRGLDFDQCFTSARSELPCAEMSTRSPRFSAGAIRSSQ